MEPIELTARRNALGLSQQALADILDISQAKIAHMERGARPIPPGFADELAILEDRIDTRSHGLAFQPGDQIVVLDEPMERTAAAWAAARLRRGGHDSRIVAARPNAVFLADQDDAGTASLVELDETDVVYADLRPVGAPELDLLYAGEHRDYRLTSDMIHMGDGSGFYRIEPR